MFNYQLDFQSPWYLLLLGLLPLLWWFSFRSLAGLGNIRRVDRDRPAARSCCC